MAKKAGSLFAPTGVGIILKDPLNNSFIIKIGDSEIRRSVPDQRKLSLQWDVGFTKFETSFTIDPTGVPQFINEFEKIDE